MSLGEIFLVDGACSSGKSSDVRLEAARIPLAGEDRLLMFDANSSTGGLFEVMEFSARFQGSMFVDEATKRVGRAFTVTPMDPGFVLLPMLEAAKARKSPIQYIISACNDRASGIRAVLSGAADTPGKSSPGTVSAGFASSSSTGLEGSGATADAMESPTPLATPTSSKSAALTPASSAKEPRPPRGDWSYVHRIGAHLRQCSALRALCEVDDRFGDDMRLYRLDEQRAVAWVAAKAVAAARVLASEGAKAEAEHGSAGKFAVSSTSIKGTSQGSGSGASGAAGGGGASVASGWPSREHLLEGLRLIARYASDDWVVRAAEALGISERDLTGASQQRKRAAPSSMSELEAQTKAGASGAGGKASAVHAKVRAASSSSKGSAKSSGKGKGKGKAGAATGMKSLTSFFGKPSGSSSGGKKRRK